MHTLKRTKSVDSFNMMCRDTVKQISALRRDGLVGTLDNDPFLAFQLPIVESGIRAITLAEASQRQEEDRSYSPFLGLLAGFFSPKPKRRANNDNLKLRGMRHLKDARKTITSTAKERENILAVCEYAFGEVYVRDFDERGPKFNVKLDPQQFPESSKECLFERSRLLRYLSLRIMSISGLFSVYHRRGMSEEVLRALGGEARETLMKLKSRIGASPEYHAITIQLMRLLNETIIVNRKAQYSKAVNQIIRAAEDAITRYETFMHLESSRATATESHRQTLEARMLYWRDTLNKFNLPAEVILSSDNDTLEHFSLLAQQNEDRYALLKEPLLEELGLNVLFKGDPDSLGIRRIGKAKGSFGDIGKFLLREPTRFPGVPWLVSELAVKTVRVTNGASRNKDAARKRCKRMIRELRVWCKMQHERIVPILGIWDTQERDAEFCMVSPWISDDQLDHYVMTVRPQKLEALSLMHDIASGLDYMHSFGSGVVHGDLKPDNILIKDGRALITDFGLSHNMDDPRGLTSEIHGNFAWLAPEAIAAKCERGFSKRTFKPTFAQDMYSFGCLFLFVVYGEMPFERLGDSPESILTAREKYPYENPIGMNDATRLDIEQCYLMLECWRVDPTLRITAKLALEYVENLISIEKRPRNVVDPVVISQAPLITSLSSDKTQKTSGVSRRHPSQDLLSKSRPSVSQNTELVFALLPWQMKGSSLT